MVMVCAWLGLLATGVAHADTRAWLDRDRIVLGESATLNIETDQAGVAAPDYGALRGDFRLSGHSSRRSLERTNGRTESRTLFAVALEPRRAGVIGIPALDVGAERTPPLALTVLPADAGSTPARAGETVFIELSVDDTAPYVQQAVGVAVRLHHAVPLVSGELDLRAPDGATLQRVGDDIQYTRELAGKRYSVLERRYLLIPERSGPLVLPPAVFEGRGIGGFFDDLFGNGMGERLQARSRAATLDVQPAPAAAPQPWLPLHDLRLRYTTAPSTARAGEAATVVVEAKVDGAGAASLPELALSAGDGAQVFAEPPQVDERLEDGRPQATVTRRFSIVPARAGTLRIEGPSLRWWDVGADTARTTTLPAIELDVAPGQGGFAAPPSAAARDAADAGRTAASGDATGWVRVPGIQGQARVWAVVAVGFALLWLVTLAWGLGRRPAGVPAQVPRLEAAKAGGQARSVALRRALEGGDLADVVDAVAAMAPAAARARGDWRAWLAEPSQRDAIDAIEQARWGQGDPAAARTAARDAFARGLRWRDAQATASAREPLPPLYPERKR
ncbi:MAG TPA: BatD family protein [Xanthomonadaceae bacterium]|nr:BatD family protein [Xanthomonadaceae bacterium]